MPSWCGHRGFLTYQSLRENAGGGKSEETSFLTSTRGWGWRGGKPVAVGQGRRQALPQVDRQATACSEGRGQENLLPPATQAGRALEALTTVCKLEFYVICDGRREKTH